jgi:hypothetical protein
MRLLLLLLYSTRTCMRLLLLLLLLYSTRTCMRLLLLLLLLLPALPTLSLPASR